MTAVSRYRPAPELYSGGLGRYEISILHMIMQRLPANFTSGDRVMSCDFHC